MKKIGSKSRNRWYIRISDIEIWWLYPFWPSFDIFSRPVATPVSTVCSNYNEYRAIHYIHDNPLHTVETISLLRIGCVTAIHGSSEWYNNIFKILRTFRLLRPARPQSSIITEPADHGRVCQLPKAAMMMINVNMIDSNYTHKQTRTLLILGSTYRDLSS